MNIIDFINHFPDEESCEIYLKGDGKSLEFAAKAARLSLNIIGLVVVNFSNAIVAGVEAL